MKMMILSVLCMSALLAVSGQEAWIMFYNVENLFDTRDDSLTRDEEYLPEAQKRWTLERLNRKTVRIYQTLLAAGAGELPAVVGLCEVENRAVLNRLVYDTPLSRAGYRIIHRDSPDARGVDVALLYRPDLFMPATEEWLTVDLPDGDQTREILHVSGKLLGIDSVHIYVNHWPSRYGGAAGSQARRFAAAAALAGSVRKVMLCQPRANILIMGDFNDEPNDESLLMLNRICAFGDNTKNKFLINLALNEGPVHAGTIKHQGHWATFDQFLVSEAVFQGMNGLFLAAPGMSIFTLNFLMETDEKYAGKKPFRTYIGPAYHGGFSDHLPVGIRLKVSYLETPERFLDDLEVNISESD